MRIIWSREARTQKDAIWLFLAEGSVDYADRVEFRLEARVSSLGALPKQGRPAKHGLRRLSIPDIQYVVIYQIEDDMIRIMRLSSTRRIEDR